MPAIVGAALGLLLGSIAFAQNIGLTAQVLVWLGLATTYASVGALVAVIPTLGPRWFFGLAVGILYSLPGAIFVTIPYPFRDGIDPFWYDLGAGDMVDFFMTLFWGGIAGLICGWSKSKDRTAL